MESDDKKAKADQLIEHCMAHGDSLGEAMRRADSYLQAEQVDTREKLEADVHSAIFRWGWDSEWSRNVQRINECVVRSWLNRQAEITKRECSPETIDNMLNEIGELEEQVAELTAERDDLAHELRRARKAAKRWYELASGYRDKAAQFVEIIETLTATLDRKNARIKRLRGKLKRARNK